MAKGWKLLVHGTVLVDDLFPFEADIGEIFISHSCPR